MQMKVPTVLAEAMSAVFTAQQVLDQIFSQQAIEDEEEEEEEVSEEEDGEEHDPDQDASSSDDEEFPQTEGETFLSKNGKIAWSSSPFNDQGRRASHNVINMTPGPTTYAAAHAKDIVSTFLMFISPPIKKIILEMTNMEGVRRYGGEWKKVDDTDLQVFIVLFSIIIIL